MRVCLIIDAWEPIWGGGQTHVWELSKLLIRKNISIDIYTRHLLGGEKSFSDKISYFKDKITIYRIGPKTEFFNLFGRLVWIPIVIKEIIQNHHQRPYSLIHGHAYIGAIPTKVLGIALKIPTIFTVHGSNQLDLNKKNFSTFIERILLTRLKFNQMISVSHNFLRYSNVNKNIVVIPNGVDITRFDKKPIKKSQKFTILFVGRFDPIKGVDLLLKSFASLRSKRNHVVLKLIGYGYEENKLKQLANQLGIESQVKFLGKISQSELINHYYQADVLVLPSLSEGQSIVILESYAAKLPVIATNVGDTSLIVKNHKTGYLIKPNNISDLKETLIKAISNKQLRKLGHYGYKLIKELYSWEKSANKIYAIYKKYE